MPQVVLPLSAPPPPVVPVRLPLTINPSFLASDLNITAVLQTLLGNPKYLSQMRKCCASLQPSSRTPSWNEATLVMNNPGVDAVANSQNDGIDVTGRAARRRGLIEERIKAGDW